MTQNRSKFAALKWMVFIIFCLPAFLLHAEEVSESSEDSDENAPPPPITIQVTGYAFYEQSEADKPDPKRLLAIRASRLDAYRNLAERVYGISVAGNSTVKDFTLASDEFSVHLESVIRGARVVSIVENKQTGIETVLELSLPGNFAECLSKTNTFKPTSECIQPIPAVSASSAQRGGRAPMNKQYLLN